MPNLEPVTGDGHRYTIRHVGPRAAVFPTSPAANVTVLARSDMVARPLPMSGDVSSPDFVSGSWTGRLGDAGEATLVFPNREASDGVPWRQRFSPTGHLQFIEIYDNGLLDFCGVIDTVQVDQQQVQVHCQDGWFLLKKAFERDWVVVMAPRDVIERGTQVWVPVTTDNFPAGSLNARWTPTSSGGGSVSIGASGGLSLTVPAILGAAAQVQTAVVGPSSTPTWRAAFIVQASALPAGSFSFSYALNMEIGEAGDGGLTLSLWQGKAQIGNGALPTTIPANGNYAVVLECDGEWLSAFVNGQLIGTIRRTLPVGTGLQTTIALTSEGTYSGTVTVSGVLVECGVPFLMRGADKGDYVLPGVPSTYPSGGLAARYYNDADLASDSGRLAKILNPTRSQAYAGSGPQEYADQQDPTINNQANPTPGASTSNWSAKWFGAIYLKASAGNYIFDVGTPGTSAVRLWIGQTTFGTQVIDQWAWNASSIYSWTGLPPAGTLSYGGGTVERDGWYPIKIEYAVDSTSLTAPWLKFQPPASYTDPGGTALTGGSLVIVPATSLSPLGCVDQRYQGVSHFDLVQQTIQAFGYQASVEPQQLESGLFPGVLAPRVREGHDTDIVLMPDTGPRQDGEGLLNYSSTLDATDTAASLQGNGAGFQNGTSGQLQSLGFDPPTLLASLFDVQGWQDFSDASLPALLQALLNSALGLRLQPWQLFSADPNGSPRLAYTWPLPGALAAMRRRPGDGLRIQARDINVYDTTPRQMLVITRNITPYGKTSTTASFANRPRNAAHSIRQQLYTATRLQRNYQRQLVTLTGNYVSGSIAHGATGALSIIALQPSDRIVRASLRITVNSGPVSFDVVVNGSDVTTTLNGPWTVVPVNLPLNAVAVPGASNSLSAAVLNNSGSTASDIEYQLLCDVTR